MSLNEINEMTNKQPWTTTMAAIYRHDPCTDGWAKLRKHTGLSATDDTTPVSLLTILDSNGLDDALWCLRAVEGHEREMRLYAVWCARQVQHLMTDQRSLDALDVAERYANGEATDAELTAARDAAWAARDAAWAAWAAAGAAWAAAAAAWAAAEAAWAAAEAAAWAAARTAAEAAWAAAEAAAWADAARTAAEAAWAAAEAAAWADAAREAQEVKFREMVG